MSSATEPNFPTKITSRRTLPESLRLWNRKLHYYTGLYLMFFIWLFAFTGLLLNHSSWKFAEFWSNRRETTYDAPIRPPPTEGDLAQARDLLRQLGIRGEIEWTTTRKETNLFDFRASAAGKIYDIKADLANQRVTVKRIEFNKWGIMRVLHTFSGLRADDSRNSRDWVWTQVWALSMDAVAIGLILMTLSSLYMWYSLRPKRLIGSIALIAGCMCCGLFCFGLRWLY